MSTAKSVNRFFAFNPGGNIFYLRDGTIISYAVIWKCVSEGIIKNLQKLTVLQMNNVTIRQEWIRNQRQLDYILSAVRHPEGLGNTIKQTYIFTCIHAYKCTYIVLSLRDEFVRVTAYIHLFHTLTHIHSYTHTYIHAFILYILTKAINI